MNDWDAVFENSKKNGKTLLERMVGSRNNDVDDDFYPTPPMATIALMDREKFIGSISEPACGDGSMSKVIEGYGYSVRSTDLIYRGYGKGGVDFLRSTSRHENVITNPPFKIANQFIHKALVKTDHQICLLLRLNYLETQKRKKLFEFKSFPFRKLWVFSERIPFKGGQNMMAFGWFIWTRDYKGDPTIGWI